MAEKSIKATQARKDLAEVPESKPEPVLTYSKDYPIPAPNSSLARVRKGK